MATDKTTSGYTKNVKLSISDINNIEPTKKRCEDQMNALQLNNDTRKVFYSGILWCKGFYHNENLLKDELLTAAKQLLLAVASTDIKVYPDNDETPDYIQNLEDAVNKFNS